MLEAWTSLPADVRAALVKMETNAAKNSSESSGTSTTSSTDEDKTESEFIEEDIESGTMIVLKPLERAPKNVFSFSKTSTLENTQVERTPGATVTTKTTIVSRTRGWRNIFTLPISYDVNVVPYGTLLNPKNPQLLESTGNHPEGYNRRFAVIDEAVDKLYGDQIRAYFVANKIELTFTVLPGGEADKRPDAVDKLLDDMCAYKLRRREPFLAIG